MPAASPTCFIYTKLERTVYKSHTCFVCYESIHSSNHPLAYFQNNGRRHMLCYLNNHQTFLVKLLLYAMFIMSGADINI